MQKELKFKMTQILHMKMMLQNFQQQVDVELETTLEHPHHILQKVFDDEILNVEEEMFEKNELFNEKEQDDNEYETTKE